MVSYHSGLKIDVAPCFRYNINISIFKKGAYTFGGEVTFGSRDFLGKTFSNEYSVEAVGLIHKQCELVAAPLDWLIENGYRNEGEN